MSGADVQPDAVYYLQQLGYQKPYEPIYYEPVYDPIDIEGGPLDENGLPTPDGIPDNGWGSVAFTKTSSHWPEGQLFLEPWHQRHHFHSARWRHPRAL